jgi:hypothetical protein
MKARVLLIPVALVVVVFGLASCGDDKKTDSTTADTAAADTSVPDTTPAEEPTTTVVDPVVARVAAAQEIAGTYTGEWHNTTFNSNGAINATVAVDAATATVTISMDLGGNVFGSPDPAPLTTNIDLNSDGPFAGTDPLFGDFTIDYSAGHLTFTAPAVPGLGGKTMTVEGDFAGDSFAGTYTIVDLAEGTFESTRA